MQAQGGAGHSSAGPSLTSSNQSWLHLSLSLSLDLTETGDQEGMEDESKKAEESNWCKLIMDPIFLVFHQGHYYRNKSNPPSMDFSLSSSCNNHVLEATCQPLIIVPSKDYENKVSHPPLISVAPSFSSLGLQRRCCILLPFPRNR